jgi:hypothetical protein|tara:strand:+ start:1165 stop:1389 length:225 start_codon:yes stop_codon:yes gene_type:complete
MTQLIDPTDPRYFSETSDKSYDRHVYKLTIPGYKSVIIEDYEMLRALWFEQCRNYKGCTIDVLDVKPKRNKGFS